MADDTKFGPSKIFLYNEQQNSIMMFQSTIQREREREGEREREREREKAERNIDIGGEERGREGEGREIVRSMRLNRVYKNV